jgi:hypothetical protein
VIICPAGLAEVIGNMPGPALDRAGAVSGTRRSAIL